MDEQNKELNRLGDMYHALAKARAEFKPVKFDKVNPHFKSKFASLNAMQEATVPALSKHGLGVVQMTTVVDGKFGVGTMLTHADGGTLQFFTPMEPTKQDPQGYGSAATYARRYAYAGLLNISGEEDDDGNAASEPGDSKPKSKTITPAQADELRELARKADVDLKKICEYYGISAMGMLPASKLGHCTSKIAASATKGAQE